jgi:hypothetical protein
MRSNETAKDCAEAVFRKVTEPVKFDALADYRAKQLAEVEKATRLRAIRMAVVAQKTTARKRS